MSRGLQWLSRVWIRIREFLGSRVRSFRLFMIDVASRLTVFFSSESGHRMERLVLVRSHSPT